MKMKFINIKDKLPSNEQLVLIKTIRDGAVFKYRVCRYNTDEKIFEELNGHWTLNSVVGWVPIEEDAPLEDVVHCKDCVKRYNEILCPLAQMNETYNEDNGHDYFYTWGDSEDDDFYCAEGETNES